MANLIIYSAVNENTGERIEGTARELGQILGTSAKNINKYESQGNKLYGHWVLSKIGKEEPAEPKIVQHVTDDLRREWDEVTAPFKRLSMEIAKKKVKKEE